MTTRATPDALTDIVLEIESFIEPMGTEDPTYLRGKQSGLRLAASIVRKWREHMHSAASADREPESGLRAAAEQAVRSWEADKNAVGALHAYSQTHGGIHIKEGEDGPPEWYALLAASGFADQAMEYLRAAIQEDRAGE